MKTIPIIKKVPRSVAESWLGGFGRLSKVEWADWMDRAYKGDEVATLAISHSFSFVEKVMKLEAKKQNITEATLQSLWESISSDLLTYYRQQINDEDLLKWSHERDVVLDSIALMLCDYWKDMPRYEARLSFLHSTQLPIAV